MPDDVLADAAARHWQRSVYGEAGPDYGRAVQACISSDLEMRYVRPADFLMAVDAGVVQPLERAVRQFEGLDDGVLALSLAETVPSDYVAASSRPAPGVVIHNVNQQPITRGPREFMRSREPRNAGRSHDLARDPLKRRRTLKDDGVHVDDRRGPLPTPYRGPPAPNLFRSGEVDTPVLAAQSPQLQQQQSMSPSDMCSRSRHPMQLATWRGRGSGQALGVARCGTVNHKPTLPEPIAPGAGASDGSGGSLIGSESPANRFTGRVFSSTSWPPAPIEDEHARAWSRPETKSSAASQGQHRASDATTNPHPASFSARVMALEAQAAAEGSSSTRPPLMLGLLTFGPPERTPNTAPADAGGGTSSHFYPESQRIPNYHQPEIRVMPVPQCAPTPADQLPADSASSRPPKAPALSLRRTSRRGGRQATDLESRRRTVDIALPTTPSPTTSPVDYDDPDSANTYIGAAFSMPLHSIQHRSVPYGPSPPQLSVADFDCGIAGLPPRVGHLRYQSDSIHGSGMGAASAIPEKYAGTSSDKRRGDTSGMERSGRVDRDRDDAGGRRRGGEAVGGHAGSPVRRATAAAMGPAYPMSASYAPYEQHRGSTSLYEPPKRAAAHDRQTKAPYYQPPLFGGPPFLAQHASLPPTLPPLAAVVQQTASVSWTTTARQLQPQVVCFSLTSDI
jgi:hypothetical protein